jgi:hypothetical protein
MEPTTSRTGRQFVFREGLGDDLVMKIREFCQRHWEDFAEVPSQVVVLAGTTIAAALTVAPRGGVLPWVFDRRVGTLEIDGIVGRALICEDPNLGEFDYRMLAPAQDGVLGRPTVAIGTLDE